MRNKYTVCLALEVDCLVLHIEANCAEEAAKIALHNSVSSEDKIRLALSYKIKVEDLEPQHFAYDGMLVAGVFLGVHHSWYHIDNINHNLPIPSGV